MPLPPSIEALLTRGSDVWLVQAVAHEACRLQREADGHNTNDPEACARIGPLVVPNIQLQRTEP